MNAPPFQQTGKYPADAMLKFQNLMTEFVEMPLVYFHWSKLRCYLISNDSQSSFNFCLHQPRQLPLGIMFA